DRAASPARLSDDSDVYSSDDDEQPFYERLQPSAPALAAAGPAAAAAAPEPDSLVLSGARKPFVLAAAVARKLYPHQVHGVKWLWSLQELGRGGILGDDMGLGKTMQSCAFLAGLLGSGHARRALVIAPKTLLPQWVKELGLCGLRACTHTFLADSERAVALRSVVNGRGVLVTTYGMVQHNAALLAGPAHGGASGRDFSWDVMLLDEGHKIKNPKMKLVEQLHRLPARRPITKGLDKDASARERQTGAAIAAELRQRVEPFLLRREKKDVMPDSSGGADGIGSGGGAAGGGGGAEAGASAPASASAAGAPPAVRPSQSLPRKNDLVVWLRLTRKQSQIYRSFLETDSVKQVLNEKASPLAAITVLKKICDHPGLLSASAVRSVIAGAH
ncbi:DNA excision repair protein ERCC-6-like, partial [Tetrabaena socialis]